MARRPWDGVRERSGGRSLPKGDTNRLGCCLESVYRIKQRKIEVIIGLTTPDGEDCAGIEGLIDVDGANEDFVLKLEVDKVVVEELCPVFSAVRDIECSSTRTLDATVVLYRRVSYFIAARVAAPPNQ